MRWVVGIAKEDISRVAGELVGVGLAEQLPFGYLRFDPALALALLGDMSVEERNAARAAWTEARGVEIDFLYRQQFKDTNLATNLSLLDLPNLLVALEHLNKKEAPERVVELATRLETLVAHLNRPDALARAGVVRTAAAQRLGGWSHAQYSAADATVDRRIEQGDYTGAVRAAQALLRQAEEAGGCLSRSGPRLRNGASHAGAIPAIERSRGRRSPVPRGSPPAVRCARGIAHGRCRPD